MSVDIERDEEHDHVAHATFDGAGDLNLFSPDAVAGLRDAMYEVPGDVSVLTLRGKGDGFTGGLDLRAARDFSTKEAREFIQLLHETMQAVRNLDAVTVFGAGDYCLGAGLELAMSCDFRVATEESALGLPEIDVGLVTGIEGGLLIPLVGVQAAKKIIYTGDPVSGTEAAELGLVNAAVPVDDHDAAIEEYVETLAGKSPVVLQWQKQVFRAWRFNGLENGIEHSGEVIAHCFGLDDQTEAMDAFLEKREPEFEGR